MSWRAEMKIHWTVKSIPELKNLSKDERNIIFFKYRYFPLKHWQTWASFLIPSIVVMSSWYIAIVTFPKYIPLFSALFIHDPISYISVSLFICFPGLGTIGFIAWSEIYIWQLRKYLKMDANANPRLPPEKQ